MNQAEECFQNYLFKWMVLDPKAAQGQMMLKRMEKLKRTSWSLLPQIVLRTLTKLSADDSRSAFVNIFPLSYNFV